MLGALIGGLFGLALTAKDNAEGRERARQLEIQYRQREQIEFKHGIAYINEMAFIGLVCDQGTTYMESALERAYPAYKMLSHDRIYNCIGTPEIHQVYLKIAQRIGLSQNEIIIRYINRKLESHVKTNIHLYKGSIAYYQGRYFYAETMYNVHKDYFKTKYLCVEVEPNIAEGLIKNNLCSFSPDLAVNIPTYRVEEDKWGRHMITDLEWFKTQTEAEIEKESFLYSFICYSGDDFEGMIHSMTDDEFMTRALGTPQWKNYQYNKRIAVPFTDIDPLDFWEIRKLGFEVRDYVQSKYGTL